MNFDTFCMSPFVRMTQWWQGNLNTCTHYGEMTGDGTYSEKQVFIPKDKYNTLFSNYQIKMFLFSFAFLQLYLRDRLLLLQSGH